jgi:serine/threonine protein kinase
LFNNLYLGKKKISSGSFGVVYLGQNVRSKEYCAIKVEKSAVDDLLSLEREVSNTLNPRCKS